MNASAIQNSSEIGQHLAPLRQQEVDVVRQLLPQRAAGQELEVERQLKVGGRLAIGIELRVRIEAERQRHVRREGQEVVAGGNRIQRLLVDGHPESVAGELLAERRERGEGAVAEVAADPVFPRESGDGRGVGRKRNHERGGYEGAACQA
jgi:hypothetical protein